MVVTATSKLGLEPNKPNPAQNLAGLGLSISGKTSYPQANLSLHESLQKSMGQRRD
jgi:hypothetical protein